jgi:hypothetical protein
LRVMCWDSCVLALRMKPIIEARANEQQVRKPDSVSPKSDEQITTIRTDAAVANLAAYRQAQSLRDLSAIFVYTKIQNQLPVPSSATVRPTSRTRQTLASQQASKAGKGVFCLVRNLTKWTRQSARMKLLRVLPISAAT